MIAKITQGKFLSGLLKYNENKVKDGEASLFLTNGISDIIKNDPIFSAINSYAYESQRKDKYLHISLNFKNYDFEKLSETDKKNIIKDYLKDLGFSDPNHPFAVYLHKDKNHPHFHIVTSKILNTGKVLNDSHIYRRSQRITRKLEEKYNLEKIPSQKNIFESTNYNEIKLNLENIKKLNSEYKKAQISQKELLYQSINFILKNTKPKDFKEFQNLLNKININVYKTTHKNPGLVFSFENENKGIKASQIDKNFVLNKLDVVFEKNKKFVKKIAPFISKKIDFIFYKYDTLDVETFKKELAKYNIILLPNITNNEIRGFSFYYQGIKLKAQDLPKRAYVFSKIKHKFDNKNIISDTFKFHYLYNKNSHKIDYRNINTFIYSCLNNNFRPFIDFENKKLLLTSIDLFNSHKQFDNYKEIKEFDLTKFKSAELQKLNKKIDLIQNKIFAQSIDNFSDELSNRNKIKNIESYENLDVINSIYNDLTYQNLEDDNLFNKKRKKKKRKGPKL